MERWHGPELDHREHAIRNRQCVLTSTDLRTWFTVTTPTGTGAEILLTLTGQDTPSARFYRVSTIPPPPTAFALIPAGTFTMGDQSSPLVGGVDETAHTVTLSACYMGQTEVTYAQWQATYAWATTNGYAFDNAGEGKALDHPVHAVNWYDVVKWLTQHTLDSFRCISRFLQKRQGLSFAQLLFLLELAMVETALTFPVLSRLLGMSTAALIGLVDRLAKAGLVVCGHTPEDRRLQQATLTEKGRALAEAFAAEFEAPGNEKT